MTDKHEIQRIKQELIKKTGDFCRTYIDAEYEELCKKLIEKMARKRAVPFVAGRIEIWAAAIIHTIGGINFLFDKSFKPYATMDDICSHFEVSKSTAGQKAKVIRDMFKIGHYDPEFSTQRMIKNNPYANLGYLNGFLVNLR